MRFRFSQQNTEKRRDLILNGSISSTLFKLALPTLLMGLVQSMMPVVDNIFINRIIGTLAGSAIGYSGPIINMFIAIASGLSVAGMALIGQMNGVGNFKEAKRVSTQVVVFSFVLGLFMIPWLFFLSFPISWNVKPDISQNVWIYLAMYSMVLPFSFLESIYNAIKNASGKPEATFIRMIIMLILKIIFNFIFIYFFRWGIIGAVLASFFANLIISVWMYHELFMKDDSDSLTLKGFKFDYKILRHLFRIGFPSILTSLMLNLGFVLINVELSKYDSIVLSAQSISSSITSVCFNLPSAFGAAVTTMVSMNIGANQGLKAKMTCVIGCIWSAATAVILVAIVVPLAPHLTTLFTKDTAVLAIANKSLGIYTYSVVGFGVAMVEQGAFIGLGRTRVPLFTGFLRIWLLRYVFILATERWLSFYSVFWGNLFSNYMAAIIITILIMKVKWVSVIPQTKINEEEQLEAI